MAGKKYHRVRTVNPGKAKKKPTRRKPAAKKKGKTMAAKKKTTTRRRRRRRTPNPPRRRRRSSSSAPKRRRRRNPSNGGGRAFMGIQVFKPFKSGKLLYTLIGKAAGAFAVRKFGDPELTPASTATMGGRWTIKNHIINLLAGVAAGALIKRFKPGEAGQWVYEGAVDLGVSKAFWHEVIQAIPGGATHFGHLPAEVQQLLARAQAGDTIDDGRGNRYVVQVTAGGQKQMVPMMGLEKARPLDGLTAARPLDGLTPARPLDGYQQRKFQQRMRAERFSPTGHLTTGDGVAPIDATYMRRGSADPYTAAFMGRR